MSGELDDAIAWARATRDERAALIDTISTAGWNVDSLERHVCGGECADAISTLRLLPCIEAMAAAGGKVRSRRAIAAAGLDESTPLGEVSADQWRALFEQVNGDLPGPQERN